MAIVARIRLDLDPVRHLDRSGSPIALAGEIVVALAPIVRPRTPVVKSPPSLPSWKDGELSTSNPGCGSEGVEGRRRNAARPRRQPPPDRRGP
jgi:hypothetical protein